MPSARTKFHDDLLNSVYTLGEVTKFPLIHPIFVIPQELSLAASTSVSFSWSLPAS